MDWLLEAPCDILIPAARPDAITSKNIDRIDCRIILQGANTPSSKPVEFDTVSKNVQEIYKRIKGDSIFRDVATELAYERLKHQEVWL